MVPHELLVAKLSRSPVLSRCSRQEVARLLPFLRERRLQPGEVLCRAGQPANDIWLVLQGTLRLKRAGESPRDVSDGLVGEEAALGIRCYLSDIAAVDRATVVALEGEAMPASLREQNTRAEPFGRALIGTFASAPFADAATQAESEDLTPGIAAWKLLGWIAAVVSPLALLQLETSLVRWEQRQLSAVLVSTAMLWIFGAVPPYVAGLLVVLTCVTLGIVPTSVVLSGFASNGFFLALSVFSLGAVLIDSGVISRAFLLLMKHCPRSAFGYDLAALLTGLLLTPVVPSALDRARVLAPLAAESAQTLGYDPGSRGRMRLTLSMFMGLTIFSPMFLTGGPLNLVLYGSLPEQVQDAFPWLRWAAAALAATTTMAGAFLAAYFLVFRRPASAREPRHTIDAQLAVLGPVRSKEWLAVGGVILFLGAVATVSAHKIDHRLIALTVVCGYLVLGSLGKDQLNLRIDWSGLILLGTLIGLIATIVHVGLHETIGARLAELSEIMKYRPRVFVAILASAVVLGGLCIPSAGALIAVCAVPLALLNGMNPWVVVFVILLMNDAWIFPYQSEVYRTFRGMVQSDASFDERLFLRFNAAMAVARAVALAVSVAYWEQLRVL
jgi:DASS family divalent anion:Na+ symporter